MTTTELSRAPEREKEPSRAWRNKWRSLFRIVYDDGSPPMKEGHEYWSEFTWPTREIALEKAYESINEEIDKYGEVTQEHIDAFPIEATP